MAATNDDLLAELQNISTLLQELIDQGGAGGGSTSSGGGGGAAARGPSGRAAAKSGGLASFKGYLAAAEAGLGAGVEIAERTGILAGIRTGNLGGNRDAIIGSVAQRATQAASQTTLGRAVLVNTGQVAEREADARSAVGGLAEFLALSGSQLSDEDLQREVSRQKELSAIRQRERVRVDNAILAQGAGARGEALAKDAENFQRAARGVAELADKLGILNALIPGASGLLGNAGR